jgi:argininosuccinate lyase
MAEAPTKQKLWGGRFTGATDPLYVRSASLYYQFIILISRMHAFNQSLQYDQRMHAADVRGSIAYAKSLQLVGILTKDEELKIIEGLKAVGREWETGAVGKRRLTFAFQLTKDPP